MVGIDDEGEHDSRAALAEPLDGRVGTYGHACEESVVLVVGLLGVVQRHLIDRHGVSVVQRTYVRNSNAWTPGMAG